jgi:hypothetical protein
MVQYQPQDWHIAWLCTFVPVMFGLKSLPKNKHNIMYVYVIGSLLFGFAPMIYGAAKYFTTVITYMQEESRGTLDLRGLSIKLAVVGLVVQMQITALYYALRLIGAWKSKGEKSS